MRTLRTLFVLPMCLCAGLVVETAQAAPTNIQSFDWRNFHYAKDPNSLLSASGDSIVLHNGASTKTDADDTEISRLSVVRYADFKSDGNTEAAIEIVTPVVAREGEQDDVYVFDWQNGQPHMIFHKTYTSGAKLQVSGHSLIVIEPDAEPPDPVHWTRDVLVWKSGTFKTVSTKPTSRPK